MQPILGFAPFLGVIGSPIKYGKLSPLYRYLPLIQDRASAPRAALPQRQLPLSLCLPKTRVLLEKENAGRSLPLKEKASEGDLG